MGRIELTLNIWIIKGEDPKEFRVLSFYWACEGDGRIFTVLFECMEIRVMHSKTLSIHASLIGVSSNSL
ncbi:MAG: hypothetical protein APF81_26055 [Desulfosporosinus sp. BRH_c37]|nr:MAG: hypothetical protein APF81_26055 [Desulfosporosinus sp. BRH_c37]